MFIKAFSSSTAIHGAVGWVNNVCAEWIHNVC